MTTALFYILGLLIPIAAATSYRKGFYNGCDHGHVIGYQKGMTDMSIVAARVMTKHGLTLEVVKNDSIGDLLEQLDHK